MTVQLPDMPARMKRLPLDERGYPVAKLTFEALKLLPAA